MMSKEVVTGCFNLFVVHGRGLIECSSMQLQDIYISLNSFFKLQLCIALQRNMKIGFFYIKLDVQSDDVLPMTFYFIGFYNQFNYIAIPNLCKFLHDFKGRGGDVLLSFLCFHGYVHICKNETLERNCVSANIIPNSVPLNSENIQESLCYLSSQDCMTKKICGAKRHCIQTPNNYYEQEVLTVTA